jgi:hypothetical protein
MRTSSFAGAAGLLAALLAVAGCGGSKSAEVTGTVTVDGQVPAEGSSITFIPTDGKSRSAGALIEGGKYTARDVPVGTAKVEIRVPRPAGRPGKPQAGPGPGGDIIEESLPAKYNDKTELTFDVKSGRNEKNWDLSTKD